MTKTWYTTESHRYPQDTTCADPTSCATPGHWQEDGSEYDDLAEAEYFAKNWNDAPAVRIIRHVTSREILQTVDLTGRSSEPGSGADAVPSSA
jgi:hypothetical protein